MRESFHHVFQITTTFTLNIFQLCQFYFNKANFYNEIFSNISSCGMPASSHLNSDSHILITTPADHVGPAHKLQGSLSVPQLVKRQEATRLKICRVGENTERYKLSVCSLNVGIEAVWPQNTDSFSCFVFFTSITIRLWCCPSV